MSDFKVGWARGRAKRALIASFLLMGAAFAASAANAQTISQTYSNNTLGAMWGQIFRAPISGNVTSIEVRPRITQTATLYMFPKSSPGGPGEAFSTQSVSLVDVGSDTSSAFQKIKLDNPMPVVAGNLYQFSFSAIFLAAAHWQDSSGGCIGSSPYYPYGATTVFNKFLGCQVLAFTVTIEPPPPPPPPPPQHHTPGDDHKDLPHCAPGVNPAAAGGKSTCQ